MQEIWHMYCVNIYVYKMFEIPQVHYKLHNKTGNKYILEWIIVGKMAQLAAMPEDLGLIPGTHLVERTDSWKLPSGFHTGTAAHICAHTHYTQNKCTLNTWVIDDGVSLQSYWGRTMPIYSHPFWAAVQTTLILPIIYKDMCSLLGTDLQGLAHMSCAPSSERFGHILRGQRVVYWWLCEYMHV